MQLELKAGDWSTHWYMDSTTPVDILERMAMDALQYFGKVKEEALQRQKEQEAQCQTQEENQPEG